MIKNLPERFDIACLSAFDFGDADAKDDKLLSECPVPTGSMYNILQDKKDIITGHRGTGKSAIVQLLVGGKISFAADDGWKSIVMPLDEELDYISFRNYIFENADGRANKLLLCRTIWELIIIYRTLKVAQDSVTSSDGTINKYISDIEVMLGISKKNVGIVELIVKSKKKIGIRINTLMPNVLEPFVSIEPGAEDVVGCAGSNVMMIADCKRYVNRMLGEHKVRVYILFDRLDDFVVNEEYDTQKMLLSGLISAQTDCRQRYDNIRIKSFLRTDLFLKLDLNQFGVDKILSRREELIWSQAELKRLVGKRICFSLINALKLNSLDIGIDADRMNVSRKELSQLNDAKTAIKMASILSAEFWRNVIWIVKKTVRAEEIGRTTGYNDVLYSSIITSIMPRTVAHKTIDGKCEDIDLFEFLEEHLQLGYSQVTPRMILTFLSKCLSQVISYYGESPDISYVKLNGEYEYPLFVKTAIYRAYVHLKRDMWHAQYIWAGAWEHYVMAVFDLAVSASFTYKEFCEKNGGERQDTRQFLAFGTHTGLLRCVNEHDKYENRRYAIPKLFLRVPECDGEDECLIS